MDSPCDFVYLCRIMFALLFSLFVSGFDLVLFIDSSAVWDL